MMQFHDDKKRIWGSRQFCPKSYPAQGRSGVHNHGNSNMTSRFNQGTAKEWRNI